jgi:hypothetical protein
MELIKKTTQQNGMDVENMETQNHERKEKNERSTNNLILNTSFFSYLFSACKIPKK